MLITTPVSPVVRLRAFKLVAGLGAPRGTHSTIDELEKVDKIIRAIKRMPKDAHR